MNDSISPIVITGGAQRLGLAVALALHRENYPVVITYRKQRPLLQQLELQGIETIQADFGDEQGVAGLTEELRSRFSSLRAIIHNASEWMPEGDEEPDNRVMQSMLSVHVVAPYLLNQQCGDLLCRHGELHGHADIIGEFKGTPTLKIRPFANFAFSWIPRNQRKIPLDFDRQRSNSPKSVNGSDSCP